VVARQLQRACLSAEIVLAYVVARRALRQMPIGEVLARLRQGQRRASIPSGPEMLSEAHRLGHAVTRALKLVPGDTRCLVQALVLSRLLARRGIPAKLVIGARTAPEFLAHAWVEQGGRPVLAAGGGQFDRLVEL
jgi:hypothetical protein